MLLFYETNEEILKKVLLADKLLFMQHGRLEKNKDMV